MIPTYSKKALIGSLGTPRDSFRIPQVSLRRDSIPWAFPRDSKKGLLGSLAIPIATGTLIPEESKEGVTGSLGALSQRALMPGECQGIHRDP